MVVFRLDKPFSGRDRGRTIAFPPTPAEPPLESQDNDATARPDVQRLLLPPPRPVCDDTGAPLSDLPRGDARLAAAAPAAPRSARGVECRVTPRDRRQADPGAAAGAAARL